MSTVSACVRISSTTNDELSTDRPAFLLQFEGGPAIDHILKTAGPITGQPGALLLGNLYLLKERTQVANL